jgi:hypothetical protein
MFLEGFRRRRQLRRCIRRLGPYLVSRYGHQESYSLKQILVTLEAAGVTPLVRLFACAMYAPRHEFTAWVGESDAALAPSESAPPWLRRVWRQSASDPAELYRRLREEAIRANDGSARFVPPPEDRFDRMGRGPDAATGTRLDAMNDFRWYD